MSSPDGNKGRTPETAKALMEALRRVTSGKPRDHRNIARAAKGRLRVTVASVAQEAGVSRTLIGSEKCAYPEVRKAVLDAMGGSNEPGKRRPSSADLVNNLRKDKATLDRHVKVLATRLHDAFLHIVELRKECKRLESELAETTEMLRKATMKAKERV